MLQKSRVAAVILVFTLLAAGAAPALPLDSRSVVRSPEQASFAVVWDWLAALWGGRSESRGDRQAVPETRDGSAAGPTDGSPRTKGGGHMDPNG